jgi:zinc protease
LKIVTASALALLLTSTHGLALAGKKPRAKKPAEAQTAPPAAPVAAPPIDAPPIDAPPPVPAGEAWRAARPAAASAPSPVLPTYEALKLENGLTVLVARVEPFPLISFKLVTRGGAALDPPYEAGLTSLTYRMLEEGSGSLDALEFSDRLADLGAGFGAEADRDHGSVGIGGLARNADAMLALLADAALRPRLAEGDFARLQAQALASLERNRGSPQGLAFERIPAMIYGPGHPYGHPPAGTPETIARITLEAVKAQHARLFHPERSALVIAGKLSLEEARALAERHFADWEAEGAAPPLSVSPVAAGPRTDVRVVDKANAPQTMTVIGRPMFARGHPDEAAMTVANELYGGAFSSRLNMNLREARGFTYGAGSQVAFRIGAGVFLAYSALRQDATAPGLAEFFRELEGLRLQPPGATEVEDAKAGIVRQLTGSFETVNAVAGAAAGLFVYELPLDYFARLPDRYRAVTPADVQRVVAEYLEPNAMQVLLVGEAERIVSGVEALGLGPVTVER